MPLMFMSSRARLIDSGIARPPFEGSNCPAIDAYLLTPFYIQATAGHSGFPEIPPTGRMTPSFHLSTDFL
ncbi:MULTISPECIES: hypothetical protein [unclassified Burkholderia]|uniref:hypothetical protein n=1 Tax=unclassified Burkholderia TaxID=2613784 RepID=UPI0012E397AF|nr:MULTISPECIES: hypothetical protein [unclassified Burkholderia]